MEPTKSFFEKKVDEELCLIKALTSSENFNEIKNFLKEKDDYMTERFIVTGVQLGILKAKGPTEEEKIEIINKIIKSQSVGISHQDIEFDTLKVSKLFD